MAKTIIITGASRGIGAAVARRLAPDHDLVLVARDVAALESLASMISVPGRVALPIPGDVTSEDDVNRVVDQAVARFGNIDVLVNNAGTGTFKRFDQFSLQEVQAMFDVNFFGTFLFCKHVVPRFVARRQGHVINIASIAGLSGFATGTAYAASKFAVVGFSESLREDVKHHGVAVSIVCPGSVNTGFGSKEPAADPGEFSLEPDDVARAVAYLVSESETANTKLLELKPRKRPGTRT